MIKSIRDKCLFKSEDIFNILGQLTDCPHIELSQLDSIINNLSHNQEIFIYYKQKKPVGMISIFIEQKIIHDGKCVGHIEDLVVDKDFRGKNIAKELLSFAIKYSEFHNCYKVLLNCNDELVEFYKKNNFIHKTNGMALYL